MRIPEVWKQSSFENYQVSNKGRIRQIGAKRTIKLNPIQCKTKRPYWGAVINTPDGKRMLFASREVALAFISERPKGLMITHLNGNKKNNYVENLAYLSLKDCVANAAKHGYVHRGLNDEEKIRLKELREENKSLTQISKILGFSKTTISREVAKAKLTGEGK